MTEPAETQQTEHNARRMSQLFERLRDRRSGPAFEQLKRLNLSLSHLRALRLLAPDRVMSMKELAEALEMTPPSVTALTRRLLQTGLVQRDAHAADSRIVLLSLTPAGRLLHDELHREHHRSLVQLLQGLSTAEQAQFLDLLERAVATMRADDAPEQRAASAADTIMAPTGEIQPPQ